MTYKDAQGIIESKGSNPYTSGRVDETTIIERMVYQGRDYRYAAFQYFRNWDDEVSSEDMAVLKRVHPTLF